MACAGASFAGGTSRARCALPSFVQVEAVVAEREAAAIVRGVSSWCTVLSTGAAFVDMVAALAEVTSLRSLVGEKVGEITGAITRVDGAHHGRHGARRARGARAAGDGAGCLADRDFG